MSDPKLIMQIFKELEEKFNFQSLDKASAFKETREEIEERIAYEAPRYKILYSEAGKAKYQELLDKHNESDLPVRESMKAFQQELSEWLDSQLSNLKS